MSNINKQACDKLKSAAAKAVDNFDPNMFVETRDVLALLNENARLMAERDALRETMGGDNTRAAADIYFQLVEECEIPAGGSLVEYVDNMMDELEAAERRKAELEDLLEAEVQLWTQRYDCANSRREVAEKRIVELEAREVKLPDVEKWRSPEAVRAQNAYRVLVGQELSAAGIITKVGE